MVNVVEFHIRLNWSRTGIMVNLADLTELVKDRHNSPREQLEQRPISCLHYDHQDSEVLRQQCSEPYQCMAMEPNPQPGLTSEKYSSTELISPQNNFSWKKEGLSSEKHSSTELISPLSNFSWKKRGGMYAGTKASVCKLYILHRICA